MEANNRCKAAEQTIDYETSNVRKLTLNVEDKQDEVSELMLEPLYDAPPFPREKVTPIFKASTEALAAVKLNDILEVMKYRAPPAPLTPLFNAFCMLFDREER